MKNILTGCLIALVLLSIAEMTFRARYMAGSLVRNLVPSSSRDGYFMLISNKRPRALSRASLVSHEQPSAPLFDIRIATFGESTVQGYPYPGELAFSHFLNGIVSSQYKNKRVGVFNFGYFAETAPFSLQAFIDSAELAPEIAVFYMGNNELYAHNLVQLTPRYQWLAPYRSRLLSMLEVSRMAGFLIDQLTPKPDMTAIQARLTSFQAERYFDSGILNFKQAVDEILRQAKKRSTFVLFVIPLRNVKDFPVEEGGDTKDIPPTERVKELEASCDRVPSDCYLLGRYFKSRGEIESASLYFEKASRTPRRISWIQKEMVQYLVQVANSTPHAQVLDLEGALKARFGKDFIDDEFLIDWVHLKLHTNYLVADEIFNALQDTLRRIHGPRTAAPRSYESIAQGLLPSSKFEELARTGLEESMFVNVQFGRWRQVLETAQTLGSDDISLKAQMALGLAELKLGHIAEARGIAKAIAKRATEDEVESSIRKEFNFDPQGIRALIHLQD